METLRDIVARERRGDAVALGAPAVDRQYDYRRLCTIAWKVGNFLRHLGVRRGHAVGITHERAPTPVLSLIGTGLVGALARFDPPRNATLQAMVVPTTRLDEYELTPRTKLVAYGADPGDPSVAYFERDVWSENPTMPPGRVEPDDGLIAAGKRTYAHADVLAAAEEVAERWALAPGDRVAVRAPLTGPGTLTAGVIAPLVAGAAVLFPNTDAVGDIAVSTGAAPEPRRIAAHDVL